MGIADIARSAERRLVRAGVRRKSRANWVPRATGFTGYGSPERARVVGRVLMEDPAGNHGVAQRGWRQFITTPVPETPVTVELGGQRVHARTNEEGYFEVLILGHGLEPGWHEATVTVVLSGIREPAPVQIIGDEVTRGIISDVDDTVMVTMLPRAVLAAWNSWVKKTNTRQPVEGMAQFYAALREADEPVFYLSTGAWNTYDTLVEFVARHGLPRGPLLLTDWGPTPTGLFRSGPEHKRVQLRNLLIDFPNITFTLVGDDGQHDPMIYSDLVFEHPDRVELVAIRELSPSEHVLAHGSTTTIAQPGNYRGVPSISGRDGHALKAEWDKLSGSV
ncbi:Phosphatidate phosphatase APP1 [Corynebacterium mycetoides]|uniref:Phosphatidate phosphatase APP1 n=1 Tax=Corynebacterium mycetoides TaxID=38302 RepID=A0A1G9Q023_9CORY|nr:phosphatase domain-containing protein [Corynebacterium mycetoides]SDM03827.1 Phosphatidate phosphatase APP1 [Corynebacterium mycetoides]